ncbi:MAG: hypothetical protein ACQEQ4_10630 [Fibrobacterota bacterium]
MRSPAILYSLCVSVFVSLAGAQPALPLPAEVPTPFSPLTLTEVVRCIRSEEWKPGDDSAHVREFDLTDSSLSHTIEVDDGEGNKIEAGEYSYVFGPHGITSYRSKQHGISMGRSQEYDGQGRLIHYWDGHSRSAYQVSRSLDVSFNSFDIPQNVAYERTYSGHSSTGSRRIAYTFLPIENKYGIAGEVRSFNSKIGVSTSDTLSGVLEVSHRGDTLYEVISRVEFKNETFEETYTYRFTDDGQLVSAQFPVYLEGQFPVDPRMHRSISFTYGSSGERTQKIRTDIFNTDRTVTDTTLYTYDSRGQCTLEERIDEAGNSTRTYYYYDGVSLISEENRLAPSFRAEVSRDQIMVSGVSAQAVVHLFSPAGQNIPLSIAQHGNSVRAIKPAQDIGTGRYILRIEERGQVYSRTVFLK